ncbi:hypothetical protein C8R44DRAFT_888914 [Mycena epipterygia]|nr:hypothetical protein C8R44DRAFT_888914 [Mycena epipterygia]
MFSLKTCFCTLVSAAAFARAISLPRALATVPSNASYVALDQAGGWLVAFTKDGQEISRYLVGKAANATTHQKRVSGSCTNLSPTGLRAVAGWPQILAFAQSTWSTGSYTLQTNPSYAPSNTAISCVAPSVQNVVLTGSPHCTTSTGIIGGTISGTTGAVTVSFTSGYSSTTEWSVEVASQLSFSSTVEVSVGIPELGDATVSDTLGVSITNTVGTSFSTTVSNEITQSITINVPQGSTCSLTYNDETCFQDASGQVEFIATGWAWFDYDVAVNGFHAYGLLIEALLPNESDRNSLMSFSGGINAASIGSFNAACT